MGDGADGADAVVLSFLEENSLASYPTEDAIIATNIHGYPARLKGRRHEAFRRTKR